MKPLLREIWRSDRQGFLTILGWNILVSLLGGIGIVMLIPLLNQLEIGSGGYLPDFLLALPYGWRVAALLAAYVSRVTDDQNGFKANISAVFVAENTFRIVLYSCLRLITPETLRTALLLLPFALLGLWLGMRSSAHLNEKTAGRLVALLLVLSGVSLIVKNLGV